MALSPIQRAAVHACAEIMAVGGNATDKNDDSLFDAFIGNFASVRKDIVVELSRKVEELTAGIRTVREADVALFDNLVMGQCLYLVTCITSQATDIITDLSAEMVLYQFGPYRYGFHMSKRAPAEGVAKYRAFIAENNRRREYEVIGEKNLVDLRALCLNVLKRRMACCKDPIRLSDAEYILQHAKAESISWEKVATAAAALDIRLIDVITAASA